MYGNPGYQQPGFQQPGFQQPGFQQPGFQQPQYQPQYQAPPPPQGPTIIHMGGGDEDKGSACQFCSKETAQMPRKKCGSVAICWGIVLTPGMCCWVPCIMDGCKDTELVCIECNQTKRTLDANCC